MFTKWRSASRTTIAAAFDLAGPKVAAHKTFISASSATNKPGKPINVGGQRWLALCAWGDEAGFVGEDNGLGPVAEV
jgi:hypothetical protein